MTIASVTQIPRSTGGVLDHFGRAALAFVDYRLVSLVILVVLGAFMTIHRIHRGALPPFDSCMKVIHACGLIATGLIVGCVFLLTSPPAVDELSHESWGVIGLVTLMLTLYFGCKIFREAYRHD
jgi:hypothetical protein